MQQILSSQETRDEETSCKEKQVKEQVQRQGSMDSLSMDSLQLNKSKNGYTYILLLCEEFSGYIVFEFIFLEF